MAFIFHPGETAESLLATLRQNDFWGQIVGPHGSGKSTLLATLVPQLEEAGRRVEQFSLHDGQRRLNFDPADWDVSKQVIVDGYEQLGWLSRRRLKRACTACGAGLLVTSHRSVALPPLYSTEVTLSLARQIVAELLPPRCTLIGEEDVAQSLAQHGQNLREALFSLYDLYEARRQTTG